MRLSYSKLHDLWRIIELYNSGMKLKEIAQILGLKPSYVSSLITKGFESEVLYKYYNVNLGALGKHKPSFIMIEMPQKADILQCIDRNVRTLSLYYSYSKKPLIMMYVLEPVVIPEEVLKINNQLCHPVFSGYIEHVVIPVEKHLERKIIFKTPDEKSYSTVHDEIDELILFEAFNFFNPPVQNDVKTLEFLENIARKHMLESIPFHYYKHVKDKLYPRLVYRAHGVYSLVRVAAPTLSILNTLVNLLFKSEVLTGVDQIHILSTHPVLAILHGWSDPLKLNNPQVAHEPVEGASYEVYPYISLL
ncbi:helix-turn-helix domain-containing protein [Thermosphaera sp.]